MAAIVRKIVEKPGVERAHKFLRGLLYEDDVDYSQFESQMDGTDVVTFRENDKQFRLFGTNIHVKHGAYLACAIGFVVTIIFCITYTFYHHRGMGRNPFIDQLELIDLIYAFIVGLPCHVILFLGVFKEKKNYFWPFLIFYFSNFILNIIFIIMTSGAALFDAHKKIFGNIRYDLSWVVFQLLFTSAQGLAIYVVMRCRKYVAAKNYWKIRNEERRQEQSVHTDGVIIE